MPGTQPFIGELQRAPGRALHLGVVARLVRRLHQVQQRLHDLFGEQRRLALQLGQQPVELAFDIGATFTAGVARRQQIARTQPLRIRGRQQPFRLGDRLAQQRLGRLVLLQPDEALAEGVQQLDTRERVVLELPAEALLRAPQQVGRARPGLRADPRIGVLEHRGDEGLGLLGAPFFGHRDLGLPDRDAGPSKHRHDDRAGRRDRDPVAGDELARPVAGAVGPGEHRALVEPALDVVGECVRRRVTLGGRLLQRLHDDGVQVAAQRGGERQLVLAARRCRLDLKDRVFERTP